MTENYKDGTPVDATTAPGIEEVYENEFYMMLQEWFQKDSNSILHTVKWENSKFFYGYNDEKKCFTPNRMEDGTPVAPLPFFDSINLDAILINGKGSSSIPDRLTFVDSQVGSDTSKFNLEEFQVRKNKKYLFRVIGANAGLPLEIRIAGHKMKIIASDGNKLNPIENADTLIVNSGERYDFVLDTTGIDDTKNYFIMVKTLEVKSFEFKDLLTRNFGLATLKYINSNNKAVCLEACKDCSFNSKCKRVNCPFFPTIREATGPYSCISIGEFTSLDVKSIDKDLMRNKYDRLNFEEYFFNFHFTGSVSQRSSINGRQFVQTSVPPYFKKNPENTYTPCSCGNKIKTCECTYVQELPKNKVIQLNILNMGSGSGIDGTAHPIHIHGYHFYVVAVGFPEYNYTTLTFKKNNGDINCLNNDLCNDPNWSDPNWSNGEVSKAQYSNLLDPPRKDTILIPVGGYAAVRFKSDNIGYWFFHCHIEVHQAEGMSMIIKVGSDEEIAKSVNYKDINVCEKGPYLYQPRDDDGNIIISSSNKIFSSLKSILLFLIISFYSNL